MSQFDKLLARLRSLDKNMRFDEVKRILESFGYIMGAPSSGGSHRTFRKSGCQPITIPVDEPIKRIYIIMVRDAIESEAKDE